MTSEISVATIANSTEEQMEDILAKVDAMTEGQAAQLLSSIINELMGMQKDEK